jgi:hypothetical protein
MAMKKSTKPARPGGNTPPDTRSMKISSGVTVLGPKPFGINSPILQRKPLTAAQVTELKKMIAKAEADKKAVAKSSKKDAKIVKKQNKQAATAKSATEQQTRRIKMAKKPVVQVKPRGRMGGMLGGGSVTQRTK